MSSSKQSPFGVISSSSRSSDGIGSHQGTPETKVTAFTPDINRTPISQGSGKAPPTFTLDPAHYQLPSYMKSPNQQNHQATVQGNGPFSLGSRINDPFVSSGTSISTGISAGGQRLSPTASAFTPLSAYNSHSGGFGQFEHANTHAISGGIGFLNSNSVPDDTGVVHLKNYLNSVANAPAHVSPIGTRPSSYGSDSSGGAFQASPTKNSQAANVSVGVAKALVISGIPRTTPVNVLKDFFSVHLFPGLKGPAFVDLNTSGVIYVGFTNERDCGEVIQKTRAAHPEWMIDHVAGVQFIKKLHTQMQTVANHEGQILIKATFSGPQSAFNPESIERLLPELLANYGDLDSYNAIRVRDPGVVCIVAEYRNPSAARIATAALQGFKIQGCQLSITSSGPATQSISPPRRSPGRGKGQGEVTDLSNTFDGLNMGPHRTGREEMHTQYPIPYQFGRLSPTGRSHLPPDAPAWAPPYGYMGPVHRGGPGYVAPRVHGRGYDEYYYPEHAQWDMHGTIGQERGQPRQPRHYPARYSPNRSQGRSGGRSDSDYASGHHNVVDVERIRRGLDVRTTIMLRNIPNKIDQAMLKDIVDETSAGKYDFMYLRIDFANNCNVGYAFINFEDPYYIIDFVEARAGLRWNRFNSDKVAEVSYATIQGKDCLVQKFRNSSVMLEHPSFRPKIFHTGNGPLSGQEDVFPGPDNPSKMRRSVENAEHVGLFAPRAGQHNRDEQRRRRSQYDRGTRLAELEEAYEYDHHNNQEYLRQQDTRSSSHEGGRYVRRPARYDPQY